MSNLDWVTVTSDLQRAVNNLAWFVLESMSPPGQPGFLPTITLQPQYVSQNGGGDKALLPPFATGKLPPPPHDTVHEHDVSEALSTLCDDVSPLTAFAKSDVPFAKIEVANGKMAKGDHHLDPRNQHHHHPLLHPHHENGPNVSRTNKQAAVKKPKRTHANSGATFVAESLV